MAGCRNTFKRNRFAVIICISICTLLYTFSKLGHGSKSKGIEEYESDKRNKLDVNIRQKYMLYVNKDTDNKTDIEQFLTISEGQFFLNLSKKHPQNLQKSKFYNVSFYPMAVDLPQVVKNHKLGISIYKPINVYKYGLLHNPNEICKEDGYMLFLIKSKVSNFEQRVTIRNTWASNSLMKHLTTKRIFLIGSSTNEIDARGVLSEVAKYNDIVQFDFYDDYYNNTLKTTGAIYWANTFCNNSKFFMFIDDDFFVSTELFMKYIRSTVFKMKGHVYLGNVLKDTPNRVKGGKWFVSQTAYPYSIFPPFVRAGAMLLSRSLIEDLCIGILYTKRFIFDDVFIAIVAFKLRVTPSHQPLFIIENPVSYNEKRLKSIYVSHGYHNVKDLYKAWNCMATSSTSQMYPDYCHKVDVI